MSAWTCLICGEPLLFAGVTDAGLATWTCPRCDLSRQPEEGCYWTEDGELACWATTCGHLHCLEAGTPTDNGMRFCCYCGKPLAAAGKRDPLALHTGREPLAQVDPHSPAVGGDNHNPKEA